MSKLIIPTASLHEPTFHESVVPKHRLLALRQSLVDSEHPKTESPSVSDDKPNFRPYLVVRLSAGDKGQRPSIPNVALGPDSPSLWFEDEGSPDSVVLKPVPGRNYQIVVKVDNLGDFPSFGVCVDFFSWTRTETNDTTSIHYYENLSFSSSETIFENTSTLIRSSTWSPGENGVLFPGDVIIRAYDPISDPYNDTGTHFYVQNDRHLAHRSF